MDNNAQTRKKLAKWVIGTVSACILVYLGVQNIDAVAGAIVWLTDLIKPLLLGLVLALILNVPMRFIESRLFAKGDKPRLQKLRRPLSMILAILLILCILVGVIWLVVPELASAVRIVVNGVVELASDLARMEQAGELSEGPIGGILAGIDWERLETTVSTWLKERGGGIVDSAIGTIGSFIGGVADFFIAFVFAVYILSGKERLKRQACRLVRAWLPKRFGEWLIHAASVVSGVFRSFVSGQTLEAMILGVLCMTGMLILGIPYASTVGALVGVTAFIPIVGAYIGAIAGAFMILTVSPMKAAVFLIFLIVLQQLEGNLIYPRVMGSRINLPGMWVLAAITIGGGLAGPVGMLLGVPTASAAYVLVREATEKREERLAREAFSGDTKAQPL